MKTISDRGSMNPIQFSFWTIVIILFIIAGCLSSCSDSNSRESILFKVDVTQGDIVCTSYVYGISVSDVHEMIELSPNQYYDMEYSVDSISVDEVNPLNEPFDYVPAERLN